MKSYAEICLPIMPKIPINSAQLFERNCVQILLNCGLGASGRCVGMDALTLNDINLSASCSFRNTFLLFEKLLFRRSNNFFLNLCMFFSPSS